MRVLSNELSADYPFDARAGVTSTMKHRQARSWLDAMLHCSQSRCRGEYTCTNPLLRAILSHTDVEYSNTRRIVLGLRSTPRMKKTGSAEVTLGFPIREIPQIISHCFMQWRQQIRSFRINSGRRRLRVGSKIITVFLSSSNSLVHFVACVPMCVYSSHTGLDLHPLQKFPQALSMLLLVCRSMFNFGQCNVPLFGKISRYLIAALT